MAKRPSKSPGFKLSNIMNYVRGNIDLPKDTESVKTKAYASRETISARQRSDILGKSLQHVETGNNQQLTQASILNIVRTSMATVGKTRMENRKILSLMPNVEKAARLMIATTMSPNDLTREAVQIVFDGLDDVNENQYNRLNEMATKFFHEKLNLVSAIPSWLYQAGYESGSAVFAIVPLTSFDRIMDKEYEATENFAETIIDPIACESLFGFGDKPHKESLKEEIAGLEEFGVNILTLLHQEHVSQHRGTDIKPIIPSDNSELRKLIDKILGQESLSLTDNPSVLQLSNEVKTRSSKRVKSKIKDRYKSTEDMPIISVSASKTSENKKDLGVVGNPIFMRLPPESVTVIHTPGDPSDHQGYLLMLDRHGNPIDAVSEQVNMPAGRADFNQMQGDVFNQVYTAYGFNNSRGFGRQTQEEMMGQVYNHIVTEHLRKRMTKAGFGNTEIANSEGVMRCMFARFLQRKQTRVLFLPKDLVTYLAFELDENGYGVSRLEKIKFSLGMKMAIQVSRALASIKSAMDKRRVEVTFSDTMMDDPEAVLNTIVQEYLRKSNISFSIDPNVIQNQIADKSLSIKASQIPGMETFDLINEPDTRSGSFDFDPSILEQLDKEINNGLRVPAAAMNALGEDEYSRSVSTTNLFFAMDVAIDQDIVKKHVSDLIQKYGSYSEEFLNKVYEIVPSLKNRGKKKISGSSIENSMEDDDSDDSKSVDDLPDNYTIDTLIESMRISLPKPDVAPSKAQFEVIEAMIAAITNTVQALFPDDLLGVNDEMASTIRLLRARFISTNVRAYLDSAGMSSISVPESDFSEHYRETGVLTDAIANFAAMLKDKAAIGKPKEFDIMNTNTDGDNNGPIPGFQ
jgi:hypothetical protein